MVERIAAAAVDNEACGERFAQIVEEEELRKKKRELDATYARRRRQRLKEERVTLQLTISRLKDDQTRLNEEHGRLINLLKIANAFVTQICAQSSNVASSAIPTSIEFPAAGSGSRRANLAATHQASVPGSYHPPLAAQWGGMQPPAQLQHIMGIWKL